MASLFDGIDFNNLPSEVPAVVIKKLAIATQERFNISAVQPDGDYLGSGSPSDETLSKIFPYKSNTDLKWELNSGDPIPDLSGDIQDMMSAMLNNFWDKEKADERLGDPGFQLRTFADTADDPGTYANRLFEYTGYTSWPDLSVYAKEEVKKWYDMLAAYQWVWRTYGVEDGNPSVNTHREYNGIFDVEEAAFFGTDQDGADYFGIDPSSYEPVTNTTPYSDFKTDHAALFGTTTASYNDYTDSGTYPPGENIPYSIRVHRDTSGDYVCWAWCYIPTFIWDWTNIETSTGITGRPQDHKNHQVITNLTNNFPVGEDTNFQYPSTTTADNEIYESVVTLIRLGDVDEVKVDHDLTPVDVPVNITDLANDETIRVEVTTDAQEVIYEYWDEEDGFEYYTT